MFNWFGKKNPEETVVTANRHSGYISGKNWIAHIRKKEKWSKELKQKMNSNNTPIFNSTQNYNSTGQWTNITIADHTTPDSAITINGGPNGSMKVDVPLVVNGRDVMKEIDEMRDALLLLKRDVNLEEKYPELKQAYDDYMEMYRGLQVAEKFYETGNENE